MIIVVIHLLAQWPCTVDAKDNPDHIDNRFSYQEFQGNKFTWYNGIDTDYVMDPIADTLVYFLFIYPQRIVRVNEDSVQVKELANFEGEGSPIKDYFKKMFSKEIPALLDTIEALCFRHLVIDDQGKIIFYEARWYRQEEYHEIEDPYFLDKIASIIARSGPWLNPKKSKEHSFGYIPAGFTLYIKQGVTVTDEQ
ncbi:hypothetical protein [Taibaiella chishuiensis]|uniref:Uncharacterized protein n=1 Tax=Taibaiella chishuiensis TaxID=1434707 RepID=A0A2P8D343_9BACT|nr:hypothetical protein [Taibaiella chishuiensis]PSK91596.1 hypothetical protein B0I18_105181 [Taibaiella chishuiensis]